ncbi:MAG: hypothetical protein ACLQU5_30040 [Isosphaeraceae bacterium]
MLATTAGLAAHAGCLWAARLSAASTSGATGAAQATSTAGRAATPGHDADRVAPRAQGLTPAPTQPDCPERSRAGRLPWGRGSRGLVRPRGHVMHAGA